jgi:glycosyltransferase involved in cell wall biosynthesis
VATKLAPQPLTGRPSVSVVIPCYNYGRYLPECVATVLGQEGVAVDVMIIDDASTDDSAAVARSLAAGDERVRVIVHERNAGHIATYNEGLAAAQGTYVVLLSADDLLTTGSLARAAALLEARPDVGMVFGFSRLMTDTPPPARTKVRSWSVWSGPEWVELACRHVSNPILTPEVVMRTSLMRELVGYDPRLPHAADYLLWIRSGTRGAIGRVDGVDQGYYRVHGSNMHVDMFPGVVRDITERRHTFQILFDDDGDRLPEPERLRGLAMRALSAEALALATQILQRDRESAVPEQLVALAHEMSPQARESMAQRAYDRLALAVREGRAPANPSAMAEFGNRVRNHVRWRYWRRTGVLKAKRTVW